MKTILAIAVLAPITLVALPGGARAQDPRPADVASPEAVVEATYAAITRRPGDPPDWDRFRSLFVPGATMIPNAEQSDGEFRILTVEDFIAWIDGWTAETAPIGSDADRGFAEEGIALEIERYGDIAQAMSTYQRTVWDDDEVLGRGVNGFQLVRAEDRWWIVSIVWDEESGAGPVPDRYMPEAR